MKVKISQAYKEYKALISELEEAKKSDVSKERELVLLDHEINEIEAANLKVGEDEELEEEYKRLFSGAMSQVFDNTIPLRYLHPSSILIKLTNGRESYPSP